MTGSQVEVQLVCSGIPAGNASVTGRAAVRVLGAANGTAEVYTEIGYDFDAQEFFADHSRECVRVRGAFVSALATRCLCLRLPRWCGVEWRCIACGGVPPRPCMPA